MTTLAHIADRVLNRPLMILPGKLSLIASVLDGRIGIDGTSLIADIEAEYLKQAPEASRFVGNFELNDPSNPAAGKKPFRTTPDGVAVIAVSGSLVNRGAWVGAYSGMTSYEGLKFQLAAAAKDPTVSSILLDMDSPGGEAVGAFEVADAVRAAAGVKEVVAVVNGMAASAAYAIASGATRIVTTSSGISGSIGVVMMHADYSNKLHQAGIVPTMIFAGARKVDGNPYEKLSAKVKGELKAEIDRFYDLFVSSVAVGRSGMTEAGIRATEARTYIGADAVAIGLADAVGSFESVLSDLTGRFAPRSRQQKQKGLFMSDANVSAASTAAEISASWNKALASRGMSLEEGATIDYSAAPTDARALSACWDRVLTRRGMSLVDWTAPSAGRDVGAPAPSWDQMLTRRGMTVSE
jgi:signal peptide peptidase SppA